MEQTPNQTSQGWFLENSGHLPFGSSSPGTKETPSRKHSFSLNLPLNTTGTGHPLHCFGHPCGRQLTSSSELLSPYAKLPHGWSRPGIFPESHLPPSFRRWPWLHTPRPLPDWAHVGRTVLTVPFLTGPSSFPWSTPESPWQGKRNSSVSTAGPGREHEGPGGG